MATDDYSEPWASWERKADQADGDQYHQADDPEHVVKLLKQAEGRCMIEAHTAHGDIALAATFGCARRTLEKLLSEVPAP